MAKRECFVFLLCLGIGFVSTTGVLAQVTCGDGLVEGSETCDPPGSIVNGSGELVVDGGFEAGPLSGNWVETSTNFGQAIYSDFPYEGNYHVWIGGSVGVQEDSGVSQSIVLPNAPSAVLSFYLWMATCSGDPADYFVVRVNGNPVFSIDMTDSRCGIGYAQETVDLSAYVGQMIDLEFFGSTANNGALGNIFVDNVSLQVGDLCRDDCTLCGDDVVNHADEQCDLTDDAACPGECDDSCRCPATGACCTDGPGVVSPCVVTTRDDCEAGDGLYLGDGMACIPESECRNLLVTMESMSATAMREGVVVTWTTATEIDTVGFRVLREDPSSRSKVVDPVSGWIPAVGDSLAGASYRFLDNQRRGRSAVRYYIEDLDIYGKVTRHGPIEVERGNREGQLPAETREAVQ